MSSLYLGQSQRELVKFLKVYSLNRPKKLNVKRLSRRQHPYSQTSDNFSLQSEEEIHPAEDALMNFQPDKNKIDKVLFDGIVDDMMPARPASFFPRVTGNAEGVKTEELRELISSEGLRYSNGD